MAGRKSARDIFGLSRMSVAQTVWFTLDYIHVCILGILAIFEFVSSEYVFDIRVSREVKRDA